MTINEVTLSPPPLPARDASKTNYVVIRTWGELSRSKIKRLNSAGFDHFDCVSKDTFLCRYLAKDLDKLRNNKAIVFADIYHSEFKISPPLRRAHPDHYYEVDIIYHKGVSDSPKLRVHISVASHTRVIKFSENKARLTTLARYLDEIALVDEVRYIERAAKTIPQNGGALELGVNDWIPTLAELHHYPDFDLS
ncbi:hypothetical protein F5Y10DRAFT_240440 [Nemania abortiva]|nr:hypothetical protein F5Y10DRAFT_240440 [Nemania abortiva]